MATLKTSFEIDKVRKDFPILDSEINGKKLVYLDSGATTHKPIEVIECMKDFMLNSNGTVRRGVYSLSARSTEAFDEVRELTRDFLGADSTDEIIFTRGTTESLNLVAYSFSEAFISAGDEILISGMEHHANIVPWQLAAERKQAIIKHIPILDNGELDQEAFKTLISSGKVKLLAVNHVANSLGTINPVKEMIKLAHEHGAKVVVDGAQSAPHLDIDVQDIDADFYAFSGHKVYGPTGVGVLYGKRELLDAMPPYHGGGEMIDKVSFKKTTYAPLPFKFEAGTPAIVEVIGLGAAIKYINRLGKANIAAHENELLAYATEKAQQVEGLKIIGQAKDKASVLAFVFDDIEAFDIGTMLNEYGIAIRTGHHCAQPVMERFGVSATARLTVGLYNTKEDIDRFYEALEKVLAIFS